MFSRIQKWLNDRWPLSSATRLVLDEDIVGGPSFFYTLGIATLTVFMLQAVTGIWQLLYYTPSVEHAYDSLTFMRRQIPFGWLIHGLHYWGADAMVVLVGLHLSRIFIWGAYKHPRQLTWLLGVGLLLLTLAMSFTGAALPWDEKGYWATEVGTSIAGTVPVIGHILKDLMRGGDTMGQYTIARFFTLHAFIIPILLSAFALLHVVSFRMQGAVGPWSESRRQRIGQFWPDQVFRETLVILLVVFVLIALCVFAPPPFTGVADPMDTTYVPKPEWEFLSLYQTLKFFSGPFEPVGTVGLPVVGVLILLLVPFVDRRKERNPLKRPVAMSLFFIVMGGVIALTVVGYYSKPPGVQAATTSPPVSSSANLSMGAQAGQALFQSQGCTGCHRVNGVGGSVGPDLSDIAQRGHSQQWLIVQVTNPKRHDPTSIMPSFSRLSQQQLNQLVDYLMTLGASGTGSTEQHHHAADTTFQKSSGTQSDPPKAMSDQSGSTDSSAHSDSSGLPQTHLKAGDAAYMIGNSKHGAVLFTQNCQHCHGPQATDKVPNPGSDDGTVPPLNPIDRALYNKNPQTFVDSIDQFIQHGSIPEGPNPKLHMLPFGDQHMLTQAEIADLEAYVLSLNGVKRATIPHPGMQPMQFFIFTVIAFGLIIVGSVIIWGTNRSRKGKKDHHLHVIDIMDDQSYKE
jgi:ubiquinol-cytochrome c reductase cytochrome b subunit